MDKELSSSHIDEMHFERLIVAPEECSSEERRTVESHLRECALCREQWNKLQDFYRSVHSELEGMPTERDKAVAGRLLAREQRALAEHPLELPEHKGQMLDALYEIIEPYRRPVLQRLVRYVQLHPVRFAGASTFAVAAVVLSLVLTRTPKDTNPTHAKVENFVLSVFNRDGEVLWKRQLLGVPDGNTVHGFGGKRFVGVQDIDGTGKNVVLYIVANESEAVPGDSLICIEGDGRVRWAIKAGEPVRFGTMDFALQGKMSFGNFLLVKKTATGHPRLFAILGCRGYFPSKVEELDVRNGEELQTYWHAGSFPCALAFDVNGDGLEEVILGGNNVSYNQACIAVLDASHVSGSGVSTEEYQVSGLPQGREMCYLLFPRTELGMAVSKVPFNQVQLLSPGLNNAFTLNVRESFYDDYPATLVYTIIPPMKVATAVEGTDFRSSYDRLVKDRKLHHPLDQAYLDSLKNGVLYWDGDKFVNTPTINKRYTGAKMLP